MDSVLDAIVEIFSWVGFGGAVALGILALIIKIADGTWLAGQGVIDESGERLVVRWFDHDGGVGHAVANHEQTAKLTGRETAVIYYRRGRDGHMRLTPGSPLVRLLSLLSLGFLVLGVIALVASGILLFVQG